MDPDTGGSDVRAADVVDRRIDFQRVHVLGAVLERGGDVVPGPGADHQDVLERRLRRRGSAGAALRTGRVLVQVRHHLVPDVVGLDPPERRAVLNLVVRRPHLHRSVGNRSKGAQTDVVYPEAPMNATIRTSSTIWHGGALLQKVRPDDRHTANQVIGVVRT